MLSVLALISDLRECGSLSPLQLIDSLTSEIGTLKKEMGKYPKPAKEETDSDTALG